MATHHVHLRRACPAPVGQFTPSRRGVVSSIPAAGSGARLMQDALLLLPTETTEGGTHQNSIRIGKMQSVLPDYSHTLARRRKGGGESPHTLHCPGYIPVACGGLKPLYVRNSD
jgi:hypothetical protein